MNFTTESMGTTLENWRENLWKYKNVGLDVYMIPSLEKMIESLILQAEKKAEERVLEFVRPRVEKFIYKVESGRARSVETYADMKAIKQFLDNLQRSKEGGEV